MLASNYVRRSSSEEGPVSPFWKMLVGAVIAIALLVVAFALIPQETWDDGYALATTGRVGVRVADAPKGVGATFTYEWIACIPDPEDPGNSFLNFSDSINPFSVKVNRPCSSLDPKGHNGSRTPEHNISLMCSVLEAVSKEFAKKDPKMTVVTATVYLFSCR